MGGGRLFSDKAKNGRRKSHGERKERRSPFSVDKVGGERGREKSPVREKSSFV